MNLSETIITRLQKSHKPKDKYYIQRVYTFHGVETIKDCKDDYNLGMFFFLQMIDTFDKDYKGYVILFKNKLQNEVIRVNL
jgi:hypothetical protein